MALARDPDTLRVPAFMRKRSLSSRLRKPLVLTALDRKKVKTQKAKVKSARPADAGTPKSKVARLKKF